MGEVLTEWVAGGVPPLEAFNGIGTKMDQKVVLEHLLAPLGVSWTLLSAFYAIWLDFGSIWGSIFGPEIVLESV